MKVHSTKFVFLWFGFLLITLPSAAAESPQDTFQIHVQRILEHDPLWKSQNADIEARIEAAASLKASLLPQVSAGLKHEREDNGTETRVNKVANARVEWNVFAFGRDSARLDQYSILQEQTQAERVTAKQAAEDRAVSLLFESFAAFDRLQLTRKIHANQKRLASVAQAQYSRGFLPRQDKDKIDLNLEVLNLQERNESLAYEQALQALKLRSAGMDLRSEWPWPHGISAAMLRWLQGLDASTLTKLASQDPRIIAGELEVASQAAKGRELRSHQYPSIDFVSEYDHMLGAVDNHQLIHKIELRVPILDGLRSSSEYHASIQKSYAAENQLIALKRDRQMELEESRQNLLLEAEVLRSRDSLVEKARRIYETSVRKFEGASLPVNDVILDEDRLFTFERDRNESVARLHKNILRFCQNLSWDLTECSHRVRSDPPDP